MILFCFLLAFFTGCVAAPFISPIVTGVIIWKQGEAHKYYNEPIEAMYKNTKNSLKQLDLPIKTDEKTRDGYYIVAGENDRLKIKIREASKTITGVSIRINFMGDKPFAEVVYAEIDANTNTINYDADGKPAKNRKRLLR